MYMSLAVMLVGGSALLAEDRKGSGPMERLSEGVYQIGQGNYDQALSHILWCFDQGETTDAEFKPVRETTVIEALALLVNVHPPTVTALKARRDTALAQAGTPPKVSPAFYDVLALNRALGEDAMSEELIRNAVSSGGIKTFSTTPEKLVAVPEPSKIVRSAKSASSETEYSLPESTKIVLRTKGIYERAKVQISKFELRSRITEVKRLSIEDKVSLASKMIQLRKQIVALKRELADASPEATKSLELQMKKLFVMEKAITEAQALSKAESDYFDELSSWNDRRSE